MKDASQDDTILKPAVIQVLVENHRRFLAFIESRVESRAAAEEILQRAFVKTLEQGGGLRDEERATAWFYRILRNALVDHYRRKGTQARALEKYAEQAEVADDPELQNVVCACVMELLPTLKADYEQILRAVDLEGHDLAITAQSVGITPNNASVRLHRARQALLKQVKRACGTCAVHGCVDCTCQKKCKEPGGAASA